MMPQTQSSIAISGHDNKWVLINASPDLARQIENTPELQPRGSSLRNSPIDTVLLTNADIDHAFGLVLMRQRETPLVVYANQDMRITLAWIDILLTLFCRVEWREVGSPINLGNGIAFRAIQLQESVAFQLQDEISRSLVLVAPAVGQLTDELREAVNESDVVFFDGTFWSDDELSTVRPGSRSAREMQHLPISDGSFEFLRDSPARRKIYTHINNTNPILMPGSSERRMVEEAGIEIARDGLEIAL